MLFSVIVPTYNPSKYLPRLLQSVTFNACINDIEILISDDCSEEDFDYIFEDYKKLHIRKISNDKHYGFPRTGRENGIINANGKWVCFCDQDDYFLDNAFDKIKSYIIDNNATHYIASSFLEENSETGECIVVDAMMAWTHGKFYEKSFLVDNNIFYDDLKHCEDINLSTKVQCVLIEKQKDIHVMNDPVCVWYKHSDSLSSSNYFINSMPDYIKATLFVLIKYIKKHQDDEDKLVFDQLVFQFMRTFLHLFFYLQTPEFQKNKTKLIEAISCIQPVFDDLKKSANISGERIIELIYTDYSNFYNETRMVDCRQIPFVESISFKEWMNLYFI